MYEPSYLHIYLELAGWFMLWLIAFRLVWLFFKGAHCDEE